MAPRVSSRWHKWKGCTLHKNCITYVTLFLYRRIIVMVSRASSIWSSLSVSRILSRRSERILQKQAKQGGQVKKKFDCTLIEYGRVSAGDFFVTQKLVVSKWVRHKTSTGYRSNNAYSASYGNLKAIKHKVVEKWPFKSTKLYKENKGFTALLPPKRRSTSFWWFSLIVQRESFESG